MVLTSKPVSIAPVFFPATLISVDCTPIARPLKSATISDVKIILCILSFYKYYFEFFSLPASTSRL
jgi:hypothetical protein